MRCIKCGGDNKLKERQGNGGRCKSCNHPFAFDPKVTPGVDFTDKFFQQTLSALSADGTLFFTPRQLHYFVNQRLNARRADALKAVGCAAVVVPLVLALVLLFNGLPFPLLWGTPLLLAAAFGVALVASRGLRRRLRGGGPQEVRAEEWKVAGWYDRWRAVNGDSGRMLAPVPPAPDPSAKPVRVNPEVTNYSFDRVVVCDRPEVAQCLIANNFHFEYNCAVLGVNGYPAEVFETVMGMLRRNPALSVYALHDASVQGVRLPHILRTGRRWFAEGGAKVYDLGLLPRQIFGRPLFVERVSQLGRPPRLPREVAALLLPEEVSWLEAGNYVSLESFTPQALLRVVAQGIAKSRDPQAADALAPVTPDGGGPLLIYTSDTFG